MIDEADLVELEQAVQHALRTGETAALRLLGEGEISLVLGVGVRPDGGGPSWACKRLPPFPTEVAADRYAATIDRYLGELTRRGVTVLDTHVRRVHGAADSAVLYCVQPALPVTGLAVDIVRNDPGRAPALIADIVDTVSAVIDPSIGLDAQLSNWALVEDRLTYFDITTPLSSRPDGTSELDTEVFLASLPWVLRAPVRRFVLPDIIARYHDRRSAILDIASNLIKEGLDEFVPVVLAASAGRVEPAITEHEVRSDRRNDARMWAALQAVRRLDRAWQRHVRRRPYPFLLPTRPSRRQRRALPSRSDHRRSGARSPGDGQRCSTGLPTTPRRHD